MPDTASPRLIFHIGMGKTGTTAIQRALNRSERRGSLARQGVRYLGSAFGFLGPSYKGGQGTFSSIVQESDARQSAIAAEIQSYLDRSAAEERLDTFIFSNERSLGADRLIYPFADALVERVPETTFLITLRRPLPWIISAYKQWGVKDIQKAGAIKGFSDAARNIIRRYRPVVAWLEKYPDRTETIFVEEGGDMVELFSSRFGVDLERIERTHESPEPAELLLRALFNDRIRGPASPKEFREAIRLGPHMPRPTRIDEMLDRISDYSSADEIVRSEADTFRRIGEVAGVDLYSDPGTVPPAIDRDQTRDRLLDYLVWMVLDQARRITDLEERTRMGNSGT